MSDITEAIEEKNKEIKGLREALSQAERELDILQQAHKLISKRRSNDQLSTSQFLSPYDPNFKPRGNDEPKSLPDVAEEVLKSAQTPLHVDDIINRIQLQFNMTVKKASLVTAISKYVNKRQKFKRTKPNTYGLIGYDEKEGSEKN